MPQDARSSAAIPPAIPWRAERVTDKARMDLTSFMATRPSLSIEA